MILGSNSPFVRDLHERLAELPRHEDANGRVFHMLTPAFARWLVAHSRPANSPAKVARYRRELLDGQWTGITEITLHLADGNVIADGSHRIAALAGTDHSGIFVIIRMKLRE